MKAVIAISDSVSTNREQDGYEMFLEKIRQTFAANPGPFFTTSVAGLWDAFLAGIPDDARQHYTCHACRHFVERYGGLVSILADGSKVSALWDLDTTPEFFRPSVKAMLKIINRARVIGVHISDKAVYGEPITGDWHHMAVVAPPSLFWHSKTQKVSQRAAELSEDFKMLISALREYAPAAVDQALKLLCSDSLYRSEKVLGVAEWLRELHTHRAAVKSSEARSNITWLAVATAPAGFCHVKNTMIGTLLDDIVAGLDFGDISRRFAAKMHPLQYQRPQAAPSAGTIARAEKLMEQLGAAGALERRFARLEEIRTIWKPAPKNEAPKSEGVFSHLAPKNSQPSVSEVNAPAVVMTWEKFYKTVLPGALSIEFYAKNGRDNYSAITTAARADAPPILQWDSEQSRNPFASYVYHHGSSPQDWNLAPGFVPVSAVCFTPSMWQNGFDHRGKSVYFILQGAKDTRYKNSGNAIFPEVLKSEFHGIRSVIEAYSKSAVLGGYDEASVCGVARNAGNSNWDLLLRVKSDIGVTNYKLDRWD